MEAEMRLDKMKNWRPPAHWMKITTVDVHIEGEPLRIITGGFPDLPGKTILARRHHIRESLDHLRMTLMWEPRGHREMYGCIITPPVSPGADIGVLFMHNEGYSTGCGHGIIGLTTAVLETGMMHMEEPETTLRIDTPAGPVTAHAQVSDRRVKSVRFHNVPSFVVALDESVDVPGLGKVRYDLAFGGAFYAYVEAKQVGLTCSQEEVHSLVEKGMAIKRAVMDSRPLAHPFEKDLSFLYGTIFIAPSKTAETDSCNVCIFADGQVDRSPTGTGVSGRLAIHHARGEISINQPMIIESIIGSRFIGRIIKVTTFGPYDAVVAEVEGRAHITGRHEFLLDPDDPLMHGFILS
jgi:trans-L-3-hydroxyproline dehydratase